MSGQEDVFLVSGARTAIGGFGGSLKDICPIDLGATAIAAAIERAGLAPAEVDQSVMGQVLQTEPRDPYLARVAALQAGVGQQASALTVNRLCGSGLQAIVSAAQAIRLGESRVAVAGGAESMSRAPHLLQDMRWGRKMGDAQAIDMLTGALNDPFGAGHMGVTAENIAERQGIDRAAQDAFAAESHRRAAVAAAEGRFEAQIVPVEIKSRKGPILFAQDEHIRPETSVDGLRALRPVFKAEGSVTAGNASGMNDAAAAVILMSGSELARRGARPMARILSWAVAGVAPEVMGLGPVEAAPLALSRAGLAAGDMDVIESNEAFAAQACAVISLLNLDPARVNPNGGAIALGHPLGASGAIVAIKAMYELQRTGGRYALITLCIGGGQGIAMVIERI